MTPQRARKRKAKKPRNYKANESTFINEDARKKEIAALQKRVKNLEAIVKMFYFRFNFIAAEIQKLKKRPARRKG